MEQTRSFPVEFKAGWGGAIARQCKRGICRPVLQRTTAAYIENRRDTGLRLSEVIVLVVDFELYI